MDPTAEIFQKSFYKEILSKNSFLNESEMDKNTQTDFCCCCDKQNTERLNVGFHPTESGIKVQLIEPGNTSKNEEENSGIEKNASPSEGCEKESDAVLLEGRKFDEESPKFEMLEAESVVPKMEASQKRGTASMAGLEEDFVDQISIKKIKIAEELVESSPGKESNEKDINALEEISSLAFATNLEIFNVNEAEENFSSAVGESENAKNELDIVTNEESLVENEKDINVLEKNSSLAASAKNLEIFNVNETEKKISATGESEDAKNEIDIVTNEESLVESGKEKNEKDINLLEEISSLASAKNLEIFNVNEPEENLSAAGESEDAKDEIDIVTNEESLVESGNEGNQKVINLLEEISSSASAKNLEIFNVNEPEGNFSAAGESEDAKNELEIVTNEESLVEEISTLAASAKNEESNILNSPKDEKSSTIDENEPENEKVGEDNQNDYERSIPNNELLNPARNHLLARHWQATSHQPFVLHEVTKDSDEFHTVNNIFAPTCRGMQIEKLERIENPYLLAHYLLKKEKMNEGGIFGGVVEKNLFHGTRRQFLESICKSNFDWRRRGSSRGHKFGQGVSFTPEVSYARHYTFQDNVMILTKVLVKNSTVGNHDTTIPREGFDTTRNIPETVIVKYEDDDFLPQYVIHYKY